MWAGVVPVRPWPGSPQLPPSFAISSRVRQLVVEGVSYVYKVKGAADETYSATKPVTPGADTVRASFPAHTN